MVSPFPNNQLIWLRFVCLLEAADQSWKNVTAAYVVIVAWPIKIGRHQADCIKAVLEAQSLAELYSGDLRDGIPGIGCLQ